MLPARFVVAVFLLFSPAASASEALWEGTWAKGPERQCAVDSDYDGVSLIVTSATPKPGLYWQWSAEGGEESPHGELGQIEFQSAADPWVCYIKTITSIISLPGWIVDTECGGEGEIWQTRHVLLSAAGGDELALYDGSTVDRLYRCSAADLERASAVDIPIPAPAEQRPPSLTGMIKSFECGDSCYLTIATASGVEVAGLCETSQCQAWNDQMPKELIGAKVTIEPGIGWVVADDPNMVPVLAFHRIHWLWAATPELVSADQRSAAGEELSMETGRFGADNPWFRDFEAACRDGDTVLPDCQGGVIGAFAEHAGTNNVICDVIAHPLRFPGLEVRR